MTAPADTTRPVVRPATRTVLSLETATVKDAMHRGVFSCPYETPLKAVAVSFTGITLSAALHHWIGSRFLRKRAPASLKRIRERLDEALQKLGPPPLTLM